MVWKLSPIPCRQRGHIFRAVRSVQLTLRLSHLPFVLSSCSNDTNNIPCPDLVFPSSAITSGGTQYLALGLLSKRRKAYLITRNNLSISTCPIPKAVGRKMLRRYRNFDYGPLKYHLYGQTGKIESATTKPKPYIITMSCYWHGCSILTYIRNSNVVDLTTN